MPAEATHVLDLTGPDDLGIAHLRFTTGSPANTMNLPFVEAFLELTRRLAETSELRVLLIQGPPGNFSGGADLSRIAGMGADTWAHFIRSEFSLFGAVDELPFITIAVLDGVCLGNAAEFAVACDLRIASDRARFGFPETAVGFQGPAQRLTRYVGLGTAKRLLYEGVVLGAEEARALGLVEWVVPAGELDRAARATAERYATLPPVAVLETKRNLADAYRLPAVENEIRSSLATAATEDALEGRTAFLEKRAPVFRGR
jgi:enoyl-CoA hydratase/carnithine racemase